MVNLESPINLTSTHMSLDSGGTLEHLEKTHTDGEETQHRKSLAKPEF